MRHGNAILGELTRWMTRGLAVCLGLVVCVPAGAAELNGFAYREVVDKYCVNCHDDIEMEGDLDLFTILDDPIEQHPEIWENVIRQLHSKQMPPAKKRQPDDATHAALMSHLSGTLDAAAEANPNPGRTDTFRRLNRTEYQNAIRDLLGLEVDAAALLPADESSHGFDNVTVADLPPTLLTRYINAAQKISRLAIGAPRKRPDGHTYRIEPDVTQEQHVPGLPLGTRGGVLLGHTFPRDGEYEIHVRLTRDRNEHVEGLTREHAVEFLLDRAKVAGFTVAPPKNTRNYYFDDEQLKARVRVTAGPHDLGVTFVQDSSALLETKRQPLNVHFNMHRHPRLTPAVYQVSITGPFGGDADASTSTQTPSRERVFVSYPTNASEEEASAKKIIANLARRAYRRPVADVDLARPLAFYREAREAEGFEAGIEMALSALLVSPQFLFRIERDPADVGPMSVYTISDLELASRISFFLWSSIPDEKLLKAAARGDLREPEKLERQVRRMLADERSANLADNFASQWLYLRNLDSKTPDARVFPDFDDNLRQAFRQETQLFFKSVVREDRSVLDLIKADYTYLNERLAKHYGIDHVYGSRFRRVKLEPESHRGGLFRHGSILTVTSYATRTSPVIRGNWVLENILGTPPPPPPPNVPSLEESVIEKNLSVRERLLRHREDPACADCHDVIDPVGFALENFDAVGRWREYEEGAPVDVSANLPDGKVFLGVDGLEDAVLGQPELFVKAMTEKLLVFGLGRGVEYYDDPAIRRIVRDARNEDYKFSAVITGIINSTPFQMRTSQ